jgi:CrcB protein
VNSEPTVPIRVVLIVALGGAIGSLARWGLAELLPHSAGDVPLSTWVTNTTGALAIGVLVVAAAGRRSTRYLLPFVGVGFLGGYTTFSTYTVDVHTLLLAGQPARAVTYLLGTLGTGLPAAWAGVALTRAATGHARREPPPSEEPEP